MASSRFPGVVVDNELNKILDANMDHVAARRQARQAFKDIQLGIDHILFKVFIYIISFSTYKIRLSYKCLCIN